MFASILNFLISFGLGMLILYWACKITGTHISNQHLGIALFLASIVGVLDGATGIVFHILVLVGVLKYLTGMKILPDLLFMAIISKFITLAFNLAVWSFVSS